MSITLSNSVINTGNTPNITTGNDADKGSASDYTFGSVYSAIDTANLYQSDGASWVNLSGGGGGGTNPTTDFMPLNNTGIFVDSSIENIINQYLKTWKADKDKAEGIYLDFSAGAYYFGDFDINNNGAYLLVDEANARILTKFNGTENGFFIDRSNNIYKFGDFGLDNNGTSIFIDDNAEFLRTFNNGNRVGLQFDFNKSEFLFGDYSYVNNGNYLQIDDNNRLFALYQQNVINGIAIDDTQWNFGNFVNGCRLNIENAFAQLIGTANNTFFKLEDGGQYLELSPNLLTTSAGSNSSQHIKIFVNGTPYRIQLKNA